VVIGIGKGAIHALGLDGSAAIASWESADSFNRAVPSAHHVLALAKLYDLPAYLLVDDAVSLADIRSYKGLAAA
jgi:hypothetical protein